MKTPISRIALFAIMTVAGSLFAQAENETFPEPGRTYDVFFAENARRDNGQIKVIRKGEGSWIFVEYTFKMRPRPRVVIPPGAPPPAPEEAKSITKKLWINTQWIVSASEPESEKK
jgi:hypothetical protein